jgi:hypothetical protein
MFYGELAQMTDREPSPRVRFGSVQISFRSAQSYAPSVVVRMLPSERERRPMVGEDPI